MLHLDRLMVGAFMTLAAGLGGAAHAQPHAFAHGEPAQSIACRGHEEHDSLALRAQAATRSHWRDAHASDPRAWVRFKILGFNDFHGQLESRSLFGRPVGGAAVLASYLQAETAEAEDGTLIVHAGDQVGASPPISALLQDEPAIGFLNLLANDKCRFGREMHPQCNIVGTLGNHEFDEGVAEMLRLIDGGLHADGPFLDADFRGARFPYVVANVVDAQTGKTVLPPYVIKRVRGMPVAFIGAVLKETPSIVTPTGVAGVRFLDEAQAINGFIPELKGKGVRAIVVTIHQGARQQTFSGPTQAAPADLEGSIGDIVRHLDSEVDIVVSGHAHGFTNQLMANQQGKQILVTQAFSAGTAYADIDVAIDPASRDIVEISAGIVTTFADEGPGLTPDAQVVELVAAAARSVEPLVNRVIGEAAVDLPRAENAAGESVLGNLIADAQRAAMGTDIALMNPGGIRANLTAGTVTWGELFTVQPFGNDLVRMDLTGAQLLRLFNQQWAGQPFPRIMKSSGISYTWDASRPADDRVLAQSIRIGGAPLDPAAYYSVTVNSFMAAGGDNFTVLTGGTNRVIGPVDLDALIDFIGTLPQPFGAAIEERIERLN